MTGKISLDRRGLLYSCAELFYVHKLKKKNIAKELGISPTHVGRLLREAERKGIIKIEVKFVGRHSELEKVLKRRFALMHTRVVDFVDDYESLKTDLGKAAGQFLEIYVQMREGVRVGIGGGATLLALVEGLESRPRRIEVYPLSLFGRGPQVQYVDSTFLATYLLIKSQPLAKAYIVGVPPLPGNPELASEFTEWVLSKIPEVREVYEGSKSVDLAFVGIGTAMPSRDIFQQFSKLGITFERVLGEGAVGGINYNYFNTEGHPIGQGILTVSVDELRLMAKDPMRTVMLVAGGRHKMAAIEVALRTKMVNSLITDDATATYLLEQATKDSPQTDRRRK